MTCCDACARGAMRATARGTVAVTGSTAGGTTGATVGGSIGGPVGAYVGGAGGAAVGGAAAGKAYDVAAGIVGGDDGKNQVTLDPAAYALAPLVEWIDEALWRGAQWPEIHAAQAEGDRVTASLDPQIDPDAVWPGLPTRTIREMERAMAMQRLVARYPVRPGRPPRTRPHIGRRGGATSDVAPPNRNTTSSGSVAIVIGALAGAALGAGGAWLATRTPRRRRHRMVAMSGAGLAGALAGGYGGARWSR